MVKKRSFCSEKRMLAVKCAMKDVCIEMLMLRYATELYR